MHVDPMQQPAQLLGPHEPGVGTHAPFVHACPRGHAPHATPPIPHFVSAVPSRQVLPSQHPAQFFDEHSIASADAHVPPPASPALSTQIRFCAEQSLQASPLRPQALAAVPSTHAPFALQQPAHVDDEHPTEPSIGSWPSTLPPSRPPSSPAFTAPPHPTTNSASTTSTFRMGHRMAAAHGSVSSTHRGTFADTPRCGSRGSRLAWIGVGPSGGEFRWKIMGRTLGVAVV